MSDPRAYGGAAAYGGYGHSDGGGGGNGGAASPSPSLDSVDMTPPTSPSDNLSGGGGGAYGMRRRHASRTQGTNGGGRYHPSPADDDKYRKGKRAVRRLDMFPKVQEDYQVRTARGGLVTLVGYGIAIVLVLAEIVNWSAERGRVVEHTFVDTR